MEADSCDNDYERQDEAAYEAGEYSTHKIV